MIRGVAFPCPSNSTNVLTRVYGAKWVNPTVDSFNPTDKHSQGGQLVKTAKPNKILKVMIRVSVRAYG